MCVRARPAYQDCPLRFASDETVPPSTSHSDAAESRILSVRDRQGNVTRIVRVLSLARILAFGYFDVVRQSA